MTILSPFIEEILINAENLFVYPGNCEIGTCQNAASAKQKQRRSSKDFIFHSKILFYPL